MFWLCMGSLLLFCFYSLYIPSKKLPAYSCCGSQSAFTEVFFIIWNISVSHQDLILLFAAQTFKILYHQTSPFLSDQLMEFMAIVHADSEEYLVQK